MSTRFFPARRAGGLALVMVVGFGGASPAWVQQEIASITLDEAIEAALETNPAAVAATRAETTARWDLRQARMAWLPTVAVNSAYTNSSNERLDQATGTLVSQNYSSQLAATYEVFSGGRRLAQNRSAVAWLSAAEAQSDARRFATILATKRSFYAAAAAAELVVSAEQRLRRARQQLEFADTRLELGNATRSDVLRADLEVGNAELAVLEAESRLHTARLELGRQVGRAQEVQPVANVLPLTAPPLPDLNEIGSEAERFSPAAVAAESELRARSANVQSAYSTFLPTLRMSGGYDWASFQFPPRKRSWSFRVVGSLPLFNGLQRESALSVARTQEHVARVIAADAAIGARVDAEVAARQIATAEERVRIAGRAVELAQEDLRVQEERYQLGNATILDLQSSQLSLADAEVAAIQARHTLATAVGELEAVLGRSIAE